MNRIVYTPVNLCFEYDDDYVVEMIIENQSAFFEMISDIVGQTNGVSGKFVFSEDNELINIQKKFEVITQLIPFSVNKKELLTKVYSSFKQKAVDEEMFQKTQELLSVIENYIDEFIEYSDSELTINITNDISGLLKFADLKFNDESLSLSEKLIEYMIAVNEYKGEKLFLIVNLRSCLTDSQMEIFLKNVMLKKIRLICVENKEHKKLSNVQRIIIDEDMCVI